MSKHLKILISSIVLIATSALGLDASRIKDITTIEGDRDNQLVGYGLVVGLSGTGDSDLDYKQLALQNALKRLGVTTDGGKKAKNVAAVMVTSNIGPFVRPGSRIDVTVSSVGDASTLQGGVLLQTPLMGADNVVYAVAQGPIAVGGFLGGTGESGSTVQQNHPTVGRIAGGAIVEREITTDILNNQSMNLLLRNPDFTSSVRVADAINKQYPGIAMAKNSTSVNIHIPKDYKGQETNFIASIGKLEIFPDLAARVVINERTGTIVATSNVRLSKVAVSHGSLTITIASNNEVSQPSAFSEKGDTKEVTNTQTVVNEVKGGFEVIDEFPTIDRLTSALNALGVSSREMMSILQSLKQAGVLQAELILN